MNYASLWLPIVTARPHMMKNKLQNYAPPPHPNLLRAEDSWFSISRMHQFRKVAAWIPLGILAIGSAWRTSTELLLANKVLFLRWRPATIIRFGKFIIFSLKSSFSQSSFWLILGNLHWIISHCYVKIVLILSKSK